ncbi:MAG: FixH family protein, partial [Candidatus Entotheonellia bacterium]
DPTHFSSAVQSIPTQEGERRMQRRQAASRKPRKLSPGGLLGLGLAIIAVVWLVYAFLGELAYPPATQRAGDLEVSLYPTLTGRPRVGDNQFEVKLAEPQGRPVSPAEVAVAYRMGNLGDGSRIATRPEGYGIFSTMLSFSEAGTWDVEVLVRRPGRPEVTVPFHLNVD